MPDTDLPTENTDSAAQARSFRDRCDDLQSSAELYTLYRIMSGWCHPGVRSCDEYVLPAEDGDAVILRQSARPMEATKSWGHMAVASLIWSARAVGYLAPDNDYRNYLRRVARELHD